MQRIRAVTAMTVIVVAAAAQAAPKLPPGVFPGTPDVKAAEAGTYALDPSHTAVIAKVSHLGYSMSVFRFDRVEGKLTWDPADPAKSSLTAVVEPASIATPVPGFAKELAGKDYLNAAAFPKAMFVSKTVQKTDETHGTVAGDLTFLGKTQPMTFAVTFEGAGKGFGGHPRLGVEATTQLDPQAYGMSPFFESPIRLEIDAEFQKP